MPKKALPEKKISVTMFNTLDTKNDEKLTDKLVVNENVRYQKGGLASKRYGFNALSKTIEGGGTLSNAVALYEHEGELLQVAEGGLFSYLKSSKTWARRGDINAFDIEQFPIIRNNADQYNPSSAWAGDVVCRLWEETSAWKFNIASGDANIVIEEELESGATNAKVVANSTTFHIYYFVLGVLKVRIIQANNPTISTVISLQTDSVTTDQLIDVKPFESDYFVVAYKRTSTVLLMYVDLFGEIGVIVNGRANPISLARTGITDLKLTISRADFIAVHTLNASNQISLDILDEVLQSQASNIVVTGVSVNTMTVIENAEIDNQFELFWDEGVSSTTTSKIRALSYGSDGTTINSAEDVASNVRLASEAFNMGTETLVNSAYIGYDDPILNLPLQTTNFIINRSGVIEIKVNYGEAAFPTANTYLPRFGVKSSTEVELPILVRDRTELTATEVAVATDPLKIVALTSSGVHGLTITTGSQFLATATEDAGVLMINSGSTDYYDGVTIVEAGFHLYPENIVTADGVEVTTIAAGKYPIVVTYDYINNRGRTERSFVSTLVEHTTAGSVNINVTVPTLKLTKKENVKIRVWRAAATTGINYHLVGEADNSTASTVTISVTDPDTVLNSKEYLYTTGGILPNDGFPASTLGSASQERFWFLLNDKPNTIGYTKYGRDGIAAEWHGDLIANIPTEGGKITGISASEETTLVFREREVYYIIGQGRDNTGTFLTNLDIRRIQTDVGCKNAKTVVKYQGGTAFLSNKGFRQITPQLQVDVAFEVVEDFDNLTYTSAVVMPDTEEIRWTSLEGTTLVYNYFWKLWSTSTGQPAVGAVIWDNQYVYLRPDGEVYIEDKNIWWDNGNPYYMKIKTGWIRPNGVDGFCRLWDIDVLGDYKAPHIFRMDLAYDDEDYITESKFFKPDNIIFDSKMWGLASEVWGLEDEVFGAANVDATGAYNFGKKPKKRRCNSVQMTITEVPGTGSGESMALNVLTLSVGLKPGGRRHGKNRQF